MIMELLIKFIIKFLGDNIIWQKVYNKNYILFLVIIMKVKIFDEEHEKDLENSINKFMKENSIDIIDIKLSTACTLYGEEQIYCFTALIMYNEVSKDM